MGDTITDFKDPAKESIKGFEDVKPMVNEYSNMGSMMLKNALENENFNFSSETEKFKKIFYQNFYKII